MKKSVTLKDLARIMGISETTISRVLNGNARKYRISEKTTAIVKEKAKELGYMPNTLAQSLRLQKTNTIGLVIPDIANPYFAAIAHDIEQMAHSHGYSIILFDTDEKTDQEINALNLLRLRQVDGMILSPVGENYKHILELYNSGLPVVIVDRYFPGIELPRVYSDNYNGAYKAVEHLVNAGHRHIGCVQGLPFASPNVDRINAYRQVLTDQDLPFSETMIKGSNFGQENGYRYTLELLREHSEITAIFAVSNLIALGALQAIKKLSLKVPDDISIIAFDDQPYFDFLAAPMSAVKQNTSAIGQAAVQLLLSQINNDDNVESVIIPTELIIRQSVRSL